MAISLHFCDANCCLINCFLSLGFVYSTRELNAESVPFPGGYWLEVLAEEVPLADGPHVATDDTPPLRSIAEVYIHVSIAHCLVDMTTISCVILPLKLRSMFTLLDESTIV